MLRDGGNDISHGCNAAGPLDQPRDLPKRDRMLMAQEFFETVFILLLHTKLCRNNTLPIRTPESRPLVVEGVRLPGLDGP